MKEKDVIPGGKRKKDSASILYLSKREEKAKKIYEERKLEKTMGKENIVLEAIKVTDESVLGHEVCLLLFYLFLIFFRTLKKFIPSMTHMV